MVWINLRTCHKFNYHTNGETQNLAKKQRNQEILKYLEIYLVYLGHNRHLTNMDLPKFNEYLPWHILALHWDHLWLPLQFYDLEQVGINYCSLAEHDIVYWFSDLDLQILFLFSVRCCVSTLKESDSLLLYPLCSVGPQLLDFLLRLC